MTQVAEESTSTLRVFIVVQVRMFREGLADGLTGCDGVVVVGNASTGREAVACIGRLAPDVTIVDISTRDSLELIRDLRRLTPSARILAFAVEEDMGTIMECAEAGASGYVTADVSLAELVLAIRGLAREELTCSPRVASHLFRRLAGPDGVESSSAFRTRSLTSREGQVLALIREGRSNREIASALAIAEPTVKNHVHHLLEKLAVVNRTQAVAVLRRPATSRHVDLRVRRN
jgi:two-component system, NarL family, nitrate/nitrite response regulator NarL